MAPAKPCGPNEKQSQIVGADVKQGLETGESLVPREVFAVCGHLRNQFAIDVVIALTKNTRSGRRRMRLLPWANLRSNVASEIEHGQLS